MVEPSSLTNGPFSTCPAGHWVWSHLIYRLIREIMNCIASRGRQHNRIRACVVRGRHVRHLIDGYMEHCHAERNHQGLKNRPMSPERLTSDQANQPAHYRQQLGGMLNSYHRRAAWMFG